MTKHDRRIRYQSDAEKPVMLSLRVPRDLYDRLERYASEHRQSVTALVKDGIELRLEIDADPRSGRSGSTTDATLGQIDGASLLRDMQATLARHDTQMHALMQAIERQTIPAGNGLYGDVSYRVIHGNTAIEPEGQERPSEQEPASDTASMDTMPAVQANVLQAAQNPALAVEQPAEGDIPLHVPAFDTTRYYLGKLCPKGHEFDGTGMSLLRKHNQSCRECENERKKARRQAQRQALAP
jgi:hypothetical protein